MNRKDFIKTLAAACVAPAVAAKAIARGGSSGIKCTRITFSQSEIDRAIESIWRESGDLKDGHIFVKPEYAPLLRSIKHLTQ